VFFRNSRIDWLAVEDPKEELVWECRRNAVSGCGFCILDRLMLSARGDWECEEIVPPEKRQLNQRTALEKTGLVVAWPPFFDQQIVMLVGCRGSLFKVEALARNFRDDGGP
jgi:hypothetical protein